MIISDYYNLVYTAEDIPQHVLKQVQGIKHKALAAYNVDNVKAAEWLLDYIEYQSKDILRKQTRMGAISNNSAKLLGNYFKHIHSACRDVIESRFNKPVLSDEEAGELFFSEMLRDYLDKVTSGEKIPAKASKTFSGGAGIVSIDFGRDLERSDARDVAGLSLQSLLGSKW